MKKKDSEQVVYESNEYVDDYTVDTEIIEQPVIKADIVPKVVSLVSSADEEVMGLLALSNSLIS